MHVLKDDVSEEIPYVPDRSCARRRNGASKGVYLSSERDTHHLEDFGVKQAFV